MKPQKILLLAFSCFSLLSCEKENLINLKTEAPSKTSVETNNPGSNNNESPGSTSITPEPVSLKFTLQTKEDQMGAFYSNAMVAFDGKVWSVAGYHGVERDQESNAIWASDNGKNWYTVATAPFEPRHNSKLVVFDDKMWLFGGQDYDPAAGVTRVLEDVWYTEDGVAWVNATPPRTLGYPFYFGNPITFNDQLFYINGRRTISTVDGIHWGPIGWLPFAEKGAFATMVFHDELYIIGGETAGVKSNDIWKSSDGIHWDQITTSGPIFSARSEHTATVYDGRVYIIGGQDSAHLPTNDIWYSSDMVNWYEYEDTIPLTTSSGQSNLVFDGALWHFGGWHSSGRPTGKIWSIKEE